MLGSSGNCSQGSNSVGMDLPREHGPATSDANQRAYDATGITRPLQAGYFISCAVKIHGGTGSDAEKHLLVGCSLGTCFSLRASIGRTHMCQLWEQQRTGQKTN
jgi:hypothetical protein